MSTARRFFAWWMAWARQGQILAAGGDCRAARPPFEQVLKIDPTEPVAIEGLKGCAR